MLGSMYSAVSGLSAHQTKMNVIGNNIANINTYGFKSSRVTFTDVFYQTLSGASSSSTNTGGTNPTQLGYGAQVNSIDVVNTRAGSATTDRALDVYINGDGYLAVKDSDGAVKYTRVGILSFDASGNLVDSSGNIVLGLPTDSTTGKISLESDGTTNTTNLVPIRIDPAVYATYSEIAIGQNGEITAIQEGDPTIVRASNTGWLTNAALTETSNYSGNVNMTTTRSATVGFLGGKYESGTAIPSAAVALAADADINGAISLSWAPSTIVAGNITYTMTYKDKTGTSHTETTDQAPAATVPFQIPNMAGVDNAATVSVALGGPTGVALSGATGSLVLGTAVASTVNVNVSTYDKSGAVVTQTATWAAGDTTIALGDITLTVDPAKFGSLDADDLQNTTIGAAGAGDGETVTIANLAVVKFGNSDGLAQDGQGYYLETTNSGNAKATIAGNGGTGTLLAGSLEMSNVDLSQELTEMITTQRGFQANTKMITVSDEMLEQLVSMKR